MKGAILAVLLFASLVFADAGEAETWTDTTVVGIDAFLGSPAGVGISCRQSEGRMGITVTIFLTESDARKLIKQIEAELPTEEN
ncbi:MAG: hypothetical protein GY820_39360 [Gammaproteobacteria bacterium]|nr:hypothetical protein [Gammaproteobacteria bacterium]